MNMNERELDVAATEPTKLATLARLASEMKAGLDEMIAAERQDQAARVIWLPTGEDDAAFVRSMLQARRLRDHYLRSGELFGEPAWDMLLDLLVARLEHRQVNVSSLCIAAAVPTSTALRWIGRLIEIGLVEKVNDPKDGRRLFVGLTTEGFSRVSSYINALREVLART